MLRNKPEMLLMLVLAQIVLALLLLWGTTSILIIGKRILQAKSGRTRTSLHIVTSQVKTFFLPLLLTSILRSLLTILWGFLLVVPGIVYFFRTIFYPVVVICEDIAYRPALQHCVQMSKGKLASIAWAIIQLSLYTFIPAQIIAILLNIFVETLPTGAMIAADVISSIIFATAVVLYLLSLISIYDHFKPKGHVRN